VGQVGEKWSLGLLQHGHMNQCEELGVLLLILEFLLFENEAGGLAEG